MQKRKVPSWDVIIGIHCLQELLHHAPHRIVKILAVKTGNRNKLLQLIQEKKIPLQWAEKETLYGYAGSSSHQGFVAFIKKRVYLELNNLLHQLPEKALLLALDSIYDPQNFGALLRCAECFGVTGVLWSKNRGTDITPVVSKASSGASEMVSLYRVSNLSDALQKLKKAGFTLFVADPKGQNIEEVPFPHLSVIIMGSEGEGVQPLIRKIADHSIRTVMYGKIASLNVAQAAAVCLNKAATYLFKK